MRNVAKVGRAVKVIEGGRARCEQRIRHTHYIDLHDDVTNTVRF